MNPASASGAPNGVPKVCTKCCGSAEADWVQLRLGEGRKLLRGNSLSQKQKSIYARSWWTRTKAENEGRQETRLGYEAEVCLEEALKAHSGVVGRQVLEEGL